MLAVAMLAMALPALGGDHSSAYLGVIVEKVSPSTASALHLSGGTAITNVDQDGPACHAGLKQGDIVTAFNGNSVSGPEELASMIQSSGPGSTATLTVWRDGHSQEMKVKLGSWPRLAVAPLPPDPPRGTLSAAGTMPPMPPVPMVPDVEIRSYMPMLARSGIVVEPLSPQLCDFFGVPTNQGVLVRTVEKGGPGAAAGLKAGDVIVKVNNEPIHDMQDWKRALRAKDGKLTLAIFRDKRTQTLQMKLPENSSKLEDGDWNNFGVDMQAFSDEMAMLRPEIEGNAREWAEMAKLDQKQIDEIQRRAEEAVRSVTPEMKRQAEEWSKQAAQMKVQSEEFRKQVEQMKPEWERQAGEMAESMKPNAKQVTDMSREIQLQVKKLQPEIEKQMKEFQKQWQEQQPEFQQQMEQFEKQMREWQRNFDFSFPKEM